jgi:hypothetical protein
MEPVNVDELDTFELKSRTTDDAEWVGQFFAYGGSGADQSTVIHFAMPPGKRLGRHTGSEDLRIIAFFSSPQVEQHWSEEVWEPGDLKVTGTPNR